MPSHRFISFLTLALAAFPTDASTPRSDFKLAIAKVKPHVYHAGEREPQNGEHLVKFIMTWFPSEGASGYEVCHNCDDLIDGHGKETGDLGKHIFTNVATCDGLPCIVMKKIPEGSNSFNIRHKTEDGKYTHWSEKTQLDVTCPEEKEDRCSIFVAPAEDFVAALNAEKADTL